MAERQKYALIINGARYPVSTDEPEEYVRKIEYTLNSRIQKKQKESGMVYSEAVTMALLSIDLCDDYLKLQQQNAQLKAELDALRRNGQYNNNSRRY